MPNNNGCLEFFLGFLIAIFIALGLLAFLGISESQVAEVLELPPLATQEAPAVVTPLPPVDVTPAPNVEATPDPTPNEGTFLPAIEAGTAFLGPNFGFIEVGGGERWTYDGTAGEVLSIEVRADFPANDASAEVRLEEELFDTYVYLFDPDGNLIAENDDIQSGIQTDSQIDEFELPTTGEYTIEVRSWSDLSGGFYSLSLKSSRETTAR